jgi:phosphatidylglycerophosphatase A
MGEQVPEQAPPLGRTRFLLEALVGSVFFTGYSPIAPATVTSAFVLLPAYFLSHAPFYWHLSAIVAIFGIGVPLATDLEKVWGHDPGKVTIDEVVGTLVTFFLLPVSVPGLVLGFVLWRFFDIVKLPFIDKSQRLPGGWGIMIDDVLAGICANLTLRIAALLLPVLRFH